MSQTPGKEPKDQRIVNFDAVVSEYEGVLLRYAARIVRQHDAAQNIVQDAFIRLYRSWPQEMTPAPQMLSWLYRVVHNCAIDHLRREERRRLLHTRHAAEHDDFVMPNRGADFPPISEEAERAAAALTKLSARERQLVVLKVYEGKSYAEISEITGLTVTNVGYILHFAMKKLAAEMKKAKRNE